MKMTKTLTVLSASLILAAVASAVTPKPSATPASSPTQKSTPATKASPAEKSTSPSKAPSTEARTPETKSSPATPRFASEALPEDQPTPSPGASPANAGPPKPILYLMTQEPYTVNGKNFIRYRYDVLNKADYPAEMFAAAPSLPACGNNTNASRTWVDFFDSTGKRLYGFCALSKPADLGKIWFAMEEGVIPPSYVYIELNDRQTNTKYKSNLADTTI
jgi:hypothetical protein